MAGSELDTFNIWQYMWPHASSSIDAVIKGGRAHGAQEEDIYGCLYFYLSDQLRLFVERIQQFHISFKVLCFEAGMLSQVILDNELAPYGIPASIRFDRIEVSNVMDSNYVGINGVLTSWAPLLGGSNYATILGYFMNWTQLCQPDGSALNADRYIIKELLNSLVQKGRVTVSGFPGYLPVDYFVISKVSSAGERQKQ
jgi:hypothetical protein